MEERHERETEYNFDMMQDALYKITRHLILAYARVHTRHAEVVHEHLPRGPRGWPEYHEV